MTAVNAVLSKTQGSPLRYMGSKRILAPFVRREIDFIQPRGYVVDLFAGLGYIAQAMAPKHPVLINDGLSFIAPIARSRFTEPSVPRAKSNQVLTDIYPAFQLRKQALYKEFGHRIAFETEALHQGPEALASYFKKAEHVGNSTAFCRKAELASECRDTEHYLLTTLYFSAGYFSTLQAIELDALRYAIDKANHSSDWLLAAWLAAAAAVINAPGHAAQFLKPTTSNAHKRIRRQWRRAIWPVFSRKLEQTGPIGTRRWRARNTVCQGDAIDLLRRGFPKDVGVIYADPPYTKDQYSRFYHLYETLYLYDYPDSIGAGRYRADRFSSNFSKASSASAEFELLFKEVARLRVPLVLSYPTRSLLSRKGIDIRTLLYSYFQIERELMIDHSHSTMGASKGRSHLLAEEQIFVCYPR